MIAEAQSIWLCDPALLRAFADLHRRKPGYKNATGDRRRRWPRETLGSVPKLHRAELNGFDGALRQFEMPCSTPPRCQAGNLNTRQPT